MKKIVFLKLAVLLLLPAIFIAQPCLQSWKYRVPIVIDNSANPSALINYQKKFIIDTRALIATGTMKPDAGDLRVMDASGILLPFWIENGTVNTTQTAVWVKLNSVPANSSVTIYYFYGQILANSIANGDNTFENYDNFDGTALDFGKWAYCGPTIPIVSSGEVTFTSSSNLSDMMIESTSSFSYPIVTEMKVNTANEGVAIIGQVDGNKIGYGIAFENVSNTNSMRLIRFDGTTGVNAPLCVNLLDQSPSSNAIASGNYLGLWSYAWVSANSHELKWLTQSYSRTDMSNASVFNSSKKTIIGSYTHTGSVSVDWTITRKYSAIEPSYTLGGVTELVDFVEATNSGAYCEGDSIKLFAPSFVNAVYSWQGPNGFTSTDQNPMIANSLVINNGAYVVQVSNLTSCSMLSDSTFVTIHSASTIASITTPTTVCEGVNDGSVTINGVIGDVLHWEIANSNGGPWVHVNNNTVIEDYRDILETKHYRAIVKNGACEADSAMTVVNVDETSYGGIVMGEQELCVGTNQGSLELINKIGNVLKWQSSVDQGSNWLDIASTSSIEPYLDITDTTWYRVEIKNGTCDAVFSDTAIMVVNPLPMVNYITAFECLGKNNDFTNSSSTSSGNIVRNIWDFGDGNSSLNNNPVHTYNIASSYNVKLTSETDKGCIDSVIKVVTVYQLPTVDFTVEDVCDTVDAVFINSSSVSVGYIQEYVWTFGDGDTSIGGTATHKYPSFGTYDVILRASTNHGCVDSMSGEISVLARSSVSFITDSVCLGESISFINTSLSPFHVTDYLWNFGDGNFSTQANLNYTYTIPGTYSVLLQATTYGQCVDSKEITTVVYSNPHADYNFTEVCLYDSLELNNVSTIFSGTMDYLWQLGDGTSSTDSSFKYLYQYPNSYQVSLIATSDFGCVDDTLILIEIYPVPLANFDYINVCNTDVTPLTNVSSISSGTLTYDWDFFDGDSSNMLNPIKTYDNEGTYLIELITASNKGCSDTVQKNVTVYPLPETNFTASDKCEGEVTEFTNATTIVAGFIIHNLWNLGDGTNSITQNPEHLYLNSGHYPIKLVSTSDKGCEKDTTIVITVNAYPWVNFNFDNQCVNNVATFLNLSQINTGTMTFDWNFGDSTFSINNSPEHSYIEHGFFPVQLIASSDAGCVDSLTKFIEIYPQPLVNAGVDTSVSYGFTIQLNAIAPAATYAIWTPSETIEDNSSLTPNVRPLTDTEYKIIIVDEHGCKNQDKINVHVIEDYRVLVSNVVTPDGNGKNDTWEIFNADAFDKIYISVYNKWGLEVLNIDSYKEEWAGTYKLDRLPDGTYYYVISFDSNERVYKGAVTVIR